jgi:predicted Zn finger-like uncharacterized protein
MNCSCPKCSASIHVELDQLSEGGAYRKCPECNGRFWTHKESFVLRAYKKTGKIYCDTCGSELGAANICHGCGALHPGYCVVQLSKPARRKIRKSDYSVSLSLKPKKQIYTLAPTSSVESRKPLLVKLGLLALVVVLAVTAGLYYHNLKTMQGYSKNYVRALYGVKSGTDRSMELCLKTAADWRAKQESGQNFDARIAPGETAKLTEVKDEIDRILQQMSETPEKFSDSRAKLDRLYGIYTRLHALNLSPPKSLAEFTDATSRLQGNFDKAALELKASLPEELLDEIREVAPRYKNLQFIVAK